MAFNKNKVMAVAQKYAEKGAYDKAIVEYLKVVKEEPEDVRVWLKLGDCYSKKGARKEATSTYLKVAEYYAGQGFYLKAVAVYKQILKLDPTVIQVNLRLAELYQQLGLLSDAQSQFEHAASFFQRSGRVREALEVMQKLVDLDQDNIPNRIKLAELYSKENMREEAVQEFGVAADQLREQGRIDDFIKVVERLLWHKPDQLALGQELSEIYLERSDTKRALAKLQQCFQADPKNVDTLGLLARAFQSIGQIPKTISVYKEIARIFRDRGDEERRREIFESILALDPNDREAREGLYGPQPGASASVSQPAAYQEYDSNYAQPITSSSGMSPQPGRIPVPTSGLIGSEPNQAPAEPRAGSYQQPSLQRSIPVQVEEPHFSEPIDEVDEVEEIEEVDDMMVVEDSSSREKVISRLLTETDVFIKYGLYDKAIEHLQQVFDHAPGHLDGREKLKDLYLQMGEVERAVLELIYLADVYAEANPETSIAYLEHILQLMPGYEAAEERLRLFGIEPPSADLDTSAPESQEENQELSMSIEDALEGSVEIEESSDLLAQSQVALLVGQGPYEHTIETSSSHEMVAPSAGGVALDEELEEVEFFILQGLMEEARNMLMELSQSFPGNPLILEKFAEIDGSIESGRLVDNSFDLSAQIPNELQHDADRSTKAEDEPVKDVFEQFKQGVAEQVDVGDADTHYDLGVAYKEMGLIEDAVAEFELARENPEREALAQTMIGHCYVQAGQQTEAINAYKRGLYAFRKSQNEELELYYSLGSTYLALSDPREALYYFQKVVKREPNFRDVQSRISSIESGEPSDDAP